MEIALTGGSGFLGQHLISTLVGHGHQVRALARSDHAAATVSAVGAEPVAGDVTETAALHDLLQHCDTVVHAAALTSEWGPRESFETVNVTGTRLVVQAARARGVPRLVLVSTEAVLADGGPLVRVDESHPRPARSVGEYARTKGLAEDLVLAADGPGLHTVAVRPRFVWGPGDTSILPAIVKAAEEGRFAWVDGGRYQTSTTHVLNACAGIVAALDRGAGGAAYFVTDGPPVEFREFLVALAATRGVELGDRSLPHWLIAAAAASAEAAWRVLRLRGSPPVTRTFVALSGHEMTVDDSRARLELGYAQVISRQDGLAGLEVG